MLLRPLPHSGQFSVVPTVSAAGPASGTDLPLHCCLRIKPRIA